MRLLIAGAGQEMLQALTATLPEYDLFPCHNSRDTHALLQTLHPDMLVLSLDSFGGEGLTLLRGARYKPPVILVLSPVLSCQVMTAAAALGATHFLPLPCSVKAIAGYIRKAAPSPV